jgi:site-specific DNA-methyltransferase (adenine-specific)
MDQPAVGQPDASDFETRTFGDIICIRGDCCQVAHSLDLADVAMSFNDWPYGVTVAHWEAKQPIEALWGILKKAQNTAIHIFTATQPFATDLINGNRKWFRYDMIFSRVKASRFLQAKKMPLRKHESVLVFYAKPGIYNAQMLPGRRRADGINQKKSAFICNSLPRYDPGRRELSHPGTVLSFNESDVVRTNIPRLHPTQKPVAFLEWLLMSYTNKQNLVLDLMAGSGTTGIAALNLGRRAILIEKDPTYFEVMCKRIAEHQAKLAANA